MENKNHHKLMLRKSFGKSLWNFHSTNIIIQS